MEGLLAEHERLSMSGTFSKSLDDIQKTIDLLIKAREAIAASKGPSAAPTVRCRESLQRLSDLHGTIDPEATSLNLAKLQNPVKSSLEDVHKDLEEVRKHQTKYAKLLDKVFSLHALADDTADAPAEI